MALTSSRRPRRQGCSSRAAPSSRTPPATPAWAWRLAAAVKGYRCIFTMPDKMSTEKINRLKALRRRRWWSRRPTCPPTDPHSYYETAKRIAPRDARQLLPEPVPQPRQHRGPLPLHRPGDLGADRTARIDVFVAGLGTGGTMSGAGQVPEGEEARACRTSASTPIGSVYHGYFKTGKLAEPHVYKVEGIGEDMLCKAHGLHGARRRAPGGRQAVLRRGAAAGARGGHLRRRLARARRSTWRCELAKELGKGKIIVVVAARHAAAATSRKFYSDEWMRDNGFLDEKGAGRGARPARAASARGASPRSKGEQVDDGGRARCSEHGISQMPVLRRRRARGGHDPRVRPAQRPDRRTQRSSPTPIDPLVAPLQGVVTPETAAHAAARRSSPQDNVAVVKEGEKVVGHRHQDRPHRVPAPHRGLSRRRLRVPPLPLRIFWKGLSAEAARGSRTNWPRLWRCTLSFATSAQRASHGNVRCTPGADARTPFRPIPSARRACPCYVSGNASLHQCTLGATRSSRSLPHCLVA